MALLETSDKRRLQYTQSIVERKWIKVKQNAFEFSGAITKK
jgi:hypothetical protein